MAECRRENDDLIIVEDIGENGVPYPDIRIERKKSGWWAASPRQDEGQSRAGVPGRSVAPAGAVARYLEKALGDTEAARAINNEVSAAIVALLEQERST